ncbi:hypothetical protein MAHJHV51_56460 [Mycobacterium avium subsp. hominissuis]
MFGALYVAYRVIYFIIEDVWLTKRLREQQRVQEIRAAQQHTEMLAELRGFPARAVARVVAWLATRPR